MSVHAQSLRFSDEMITEALSFARGDDVNLRHLGRFQLHIMNQEDQYDLKLVLETLSKGEFKNDPKECIDSMKLAGWRDRDVWGWQDWANHLSGQFVPTLYGRPSWPNHK